MPWDPASYSRDDEHYRFLKLYSIDLHGVHHSLSVLRRYRRADVRRCILREIVVSYARPFSGNEGHHFHRKRPHLLSTRKVVPKASRGLHDRLLELRRRLFAHTDYSYYEPRVTKWRTASGNIFPMSFRRPDDEFLETHLEDIEALVTSVDANLASWIREIEATM